MIKSNQIILLISVIVYPSLCIQSQPAPCWEKIQRYGHGYSSPYDFTEEEFEYIAKNYSIFTVEKRHASRDYGGNPSTEAATIGTARKLKAINPDIKVLLYWNSVMNYESIYESNAIFGQHPEWVHSIWTVQSGATYEIYNLEIPECRSWWVNSITSIIQQGELDGVFIDAGPKADVSNLEEALFLALDEVRANIGEDKIIIYNGYRVPNPNKMWAGPDFIEHTNGVFIEAFLTDPLTTKEEAVFLLDRVLEAQRNSKIIVPRGSPDAVWGNTQTDISFPFAVFMLFYGPNSYFCYNWGYAKSQGMLRDYPEYNLVPGRPLGDAVRDGWLYTRELEGLSVTVDFEAKTASITEKDFIPVDIGHNAPFTRFQIRQVNAREVQISSPPEVPLQLELFSIEGRKVESVSHSSKSGGLNYTIPASVAKGIYFLHMKTGSAQSVERLFIY